MHKWIFAYKKKKAGSLVGSEGSYDIRGGIRRPQRGKKFYLGGGLAGVGKRGVAPERREIFISHGKKSAAIP